MVILNKNISYSKDEIIFLNKYISASQNENLFLLLNGTDKKINIVNNCDGEKEDLPKGYVIKISSKNDKLILTNIQNINIYEKGTTDNSYNMNIKLDISP